MTRSGSWHRRWRWLLSALLSCALSRRGGRTWATIFSESGHPSCPCLSRLDDTNSTELTPQIYQELGASFNPSEYGLGCKAHDVNIPECSDAYQCSGSFCDKSWCQRSWCYVDPSNCKFTKKRSPRFPQRYYSYATCGDMDRFTKENRLAELQGRTLRVGFTANTGGWMGAYSASGEHFEGPIENWSGPVVDFILEASRIGGFAINITVPPQSLRDNSKEFFGTSSVFDFCVYATALGKLDLCVGQYTMTNLRSSTTPFMLLDSSPMYLVVHDGSKDITEWDEFVKSFSIIFQPFTPRTWVFIIFLVMPSFALLFVFHEFAKRGSSIPDEEKVVYFNPDGTRELRIVPVRRYRAVVSALYHVYLSAFQQAWAQPVVTLGGKLNLLGVSFFILTLLAAYTANLASLLTQQAENNGIHSLDEAIQAKYRFCSERKNMELLVGLYSTVKPAMFVNDPVELGGDGKPGFSCATCQSRSRVFEMLDTRKAEHDENYCHAAIAVAEDVERLHSLGEHCNFVIRGPSILYSLNGFPVYEKNAPELISLFLRLKNDGVMEKANSLSRPLSKCPRAAIKKGYALSIADLSGVWVVSFSMALAGVLVTCILPMWRCKYESNMKHLYKRDMNGVRIRALDTEDDGELLRFGIYDLDRKEKRSSSRKGRTILTSTELEESNNS